MSYFRFLAPAILFLISAGSATAQHMNTSGSRCANDGGNADVRNCYERERQAADRDLNVVYGQTMNALGRDERPKLVQAQRAWLRYRDLFCSAEQSPYAGGTAWDTVLVACLAVLTRQQAKALRDAF